MNLAPPEFVSVPEPDPAAHASLQELERRLGARPPSPQDEGTVALICSRPDDATRWLARALDVDPVAGVPRDRWERNRTAGREKYGDRYGDMQVATMELRVAESIANGQPLWLFGDNLFLDLDLGADNLPAGSCLRVGRARLVVTAEPHDGCRRFRARFGGDALRVVADRTTRARNFRGIYLRVVEAGRIAVGDSVHVLSRG